MLLSCPIRDAHDTVSHSNLFINLSSKLERPLMELLAREALAEGSVDMISKIYDQNLEFVSLEHRLFSLDRPNSYVQYNDPTCPDAQVHGSHVPLDYLEGTEFGFRWEACCEAEVLPYETNKVHDVHNKTAQLKSCADRATGDRVFDLFQLVVCTSPPFFCLPPLFQIINSKSKCLSLLTRMLLMTWSP